MQKMENTSECQAPTSIKFWFPTGLIGFVNDQNLMTTRALANLCAVGV